jgi:hypothetical protein
MRFHGKKSVYQLFLGHLERENGNALVAAESHILCDVKNECRLTHGGTGRDKHQVL